MASSPRIANYQEDEDLGEVEKVEGGKRVEGVEHVKEIEGVRKVVRFS